MNAHEQVKEFAEKHGVAVIALEQKKQLKALLKGKTRDKLTPKEKDDLLLQMAKDLGYID